MKIDKEQLAKHHFWVLLGLLMPLLFITLVLVWTSVAAEVESKQSDLEKVKNDVQSKIKMQDIKNQQWYAALQVREKALDDQKKKAWDEAWKSQESILVFPPGLIGRYPGLKDKDFAEPLDDLPPDLREKYIVRDEPWGYKAQIEDLINIVQPVDAKGEGVVQYNGGWQAIISYVKSWVEGLENRPTLDELWLAQEDIWVQRELLRSIRQANDYTAMLTKVAGAGRPDAAKKEIAREVFQNGSWRLELAFTRDELRWTITNIGNRQQLLGHTFKIKFAQNNLPLSLWVDGEPLAPQQSLSGSVAHKTLVFNGIDSVEQMLNWRSAPVKRIDRLALTQHSQRTAAQGFKSGPFTSAGGTTTPGYPGVRPPGTMPPGTPPGTMPPPGGMTGVPPGGNPMPPPGGFPPGTPPPGGPPGFEDGPGMTGRTTNASPNGLELNRYVEANNQVRRRAVALSLIVDQSRVQDVLTALANSKLRMQITQTEWTRYRGTIQPTVADDKPIVGGPGPMPKPNPKLPPMPIPMGDPNKPMPTATTGGESSSNLVQLNVYGLISLYQQYPPKTKTPGPGPRPVGPGPGPKPVPAPMPMPATKS